LPHPVGLSGLAALDLQQARDWFDAQEIGLGDKFLADVHDTIARIAQNPRQYPVKLAVAYLAGVVWLITASCTEPKWISAQYQSHGW
jgi:hypothetical protein